MTTLDAGLQWYRDKVKLKSGTFGYKNIEDLLAIIDQIQNESVPRSEIIRWIGPKPGDYPRKINRELTEHQQGWCAGFDALTYDLWTLVLDKKES